MKVRLIFGSSIRHCGIAEMQAEAFCYRQNNEYAIGLQQGHCALAHSRSPLLCASSIQNRKHLA
jgi:hypothetical protein